MEEKTVGQSLRDRQVLRRDFLKFCALMAGTLALPASFTPTLAERLQQAKKPTVLWLEFQNCTGCVESMLRASTPSLREIVLDILSLDYQDTIMAPAGATAEKSFNDAIAVGGHILIVDGSIPTGANAYYCVSGGESAESRFKRAAQGAAAIIAAGTCACFGGIPAAAPNPTGARAARDVVSTVPTIHIPACPPNVDNITGTIVHYLTFGGLPATDALLRPLFAFGERIHDHCERRAHFDAGQYVQAWGDEGHRIGWCLYKMGCKGPETYQNCPSQRWNGHTSWPVQAGHGCVGCAQPQFWDTMSPFYRRLPNVPGFGVEATADKVGLTLTAVTAAAIAAHAIGGYVRGKNAEVSTSRARETPTEPPAAPPAAGPDKQ